MNIATHTRIYGHSSAMNTNLRPDSSGDSMYSVIKRCVDESSIKAILLSNGYEYNNKNASLIIFGIAMHVMGDAYAHKALGVDANGNYVKIEDKDEDSYGRQYYAKESLQNLWTNFYNNIKTNGTDFEGNGNKFRLKKLYKRSKASPNGKSSNWNGFEELVAMIKKPDYL